MGRPITLSPEMAEMLQEGRDTIINSLGTAMKEAGISERGACLKAGISLTAFQLARAKGKISMDTAILLADALGLKITVQKRRNNNG